MSSNRHGMSRRKFFDLAAGVAGGALAAGPLSAQVSNTSAKGANDKVRIGLIGTGNRGREVSRLWLSALPDATYVAGCDVYKMKLEQGIKMLSDEQKGAKVDSYDDYRRVLDRKDIDAIHIATPDHWHVQVMIDAIAAGKDVYVEKPLSNTLERAVAGLKAYKAAPDRIVQIGTQQRSGTNWLEAVKIVQGGELGKVTHAVLAFPGTGYGTAPEQPIPVPDGLNWDMFQGPAPKREFKQGRLRWRGWWDYGGGLVTDWGVHLTQVALWYLNAERIGPTLTSGVAQYVNFVNPDHEQSPDAFSVTWQYPDFLMTFTNATVQDWEFGRQGNYFFGPKGSLLIHRQGYEVRPPSGANPRTVAAAAGTALARRVPWREMGGDNDSFTIQHGRVWLDAIKSRTKPPADLEVGFYATLPCLLGIMAMREGKSFKWDDMNKKAVAV